MELLISNNILGTVTQNLFQSQAEPQDATALLWAFYITHSWHKKTEGGPQGLMVMKQGIKVNQPI